MESSSWIEKKELSDCPLHKGNKLEWICLEKSCEKRVFCQFCVIYDHKNIHKNFSNVCQLLNDPLLSFQRLDLVTSELDTLKPAQKHESFKAKIEEFMKKEEEKLDQLLNSIVFNLSSKFEQIRKSFHDDLASFLKSKEKDFDNIEANRKDYIDFVQNYFPQMDFKKVEQVKEGIDIIISKYFGDTELHKNLKITQDAIPLARQNEKYELFLNNRSIQGLKWRIFMDKEIYLNGVPQFRYNSAKTCGDIQFSEDDTKVKKKGANFSSTVLGENVMTNGVYEWEVEINEMNGSYICIGAINAKNDWNVKIDNYSSAMCVCSDTCAYGMNRQDGNIAMAKGDVINFVMDLDQGKFTATGPNNKYVYFANGCKGNEYVAFLGFASGSTYELTIKAK